MLHTNLLNGPIFSLLSSLIFSSMSLAKYAWKIRCFPHPLGLLLFSYCDIDTLKLILCVHRDKILCGVWTWSTTHGNFIEICLWIVHGLCFEESFLWDGDAYTLRALRYQLNAGCTKGSCCIFGPINLSDQILCSIFIFWCVHDRKVCHSLACNVLLYFAVPSLCLLFTN